MIVGVGCGEEIAEIPPNHRSFDSLEIVAVLGPEAGGIYIDRVQDATFTEDGGVIVLQRANPPYLLRFDANGDFLRAEGERGAGPGEISDPRGLAVGSDGLVAVAGQQRVVVRDSIGVELYRSLGDAFVASPRGVVAGCRDDWIVLAPRAGQDSLPGLFSMEPGGTGEPYALLGAARGNNGDHPPFVARDGDRVILFVEERNDPRLLEIECSDGRTRTVASVSLGESPRMRPVGPRSADGSQSAVWDRGTAPFPSGVGVLGDRIIWAVRFGSTIDQEGRWTRFSVLEGGAWEEIFTLDGWFTLHDAHAEFGVLLSSQTSGEPMLFVIAPESFIDGAPNDSDPEAGSP